MLMILIVIGKEFRHWTIDKIIVTDPVTLAVTINITPFRSAFNKVNDSTALHCFLYMLDSPSHILITDP